MNKLRQQIKKFKVNNIDSIKKVIFYDLEALKDEFITGDKKDFDYHFNLLKGNLEDLFNNLEDLFNNNI